MSRRFSDFSRPASRPLGIYDLAWLLPIIAFGGLCALVGAMIASPYIG